MTTTTSDPWQKLFDQVRIHDAELAALGDASRLPEATLTQVTDKALADLVAQARRRADELRAQTGHALSVEYPSEAPLDLLDDGGAAMSFMRLRTRWASLTIYSHREPRRNATIHFLVTPAPDLPGSRRIMASNPICCVTVLAADRYELRTLGAGGAAISADEVVLRAFERLLVAR